jgi:hypothetical protein
MPSFFAADAPQQQTEENASLGSCTTATALRSSPEKQLRTAAANAAQWAHQAIRQALMPVTAQQQQQQSISLCKARADSMGHKMDREQQQQQLKAPALAGRTLSDIGHQQGVRIQSEQQFSQLYQIFAEEILGTGQFGTVYGGEWEKLILKLKFN